MSGNGPVIGPGEDSAVAELRRQLRRADEAIEVPPGLWERVSVPRTESQSVPKPRHRRWRAVPIATAAVLALAAASYAAGVLWQRHTSTPSAPPLDRTTATSSATTTPSPDRTPTASETVGVNIITSTGVMPAGADLCLEIAAGGDLRGQ